MSRSYLLEYENEFEFKKRERGLKKVYMIGYRELLFRHYPEFRNGKIIGKIVGKDKDGGIKYEFPLRTDELFAQVYGTLKVHYTVYENKNLILLTNITPEDILLEACNTELTSYKGVPVSKANSSKIIFKIDLLKSIEK